MILIAGNNGISKNLVKGREGYSLIDAEVVESKDIKRISEFIRAAAPDAVVNCMEYPFIDEAEYWRGEAYNTNAYLPRDIAGVCAGLGIRFIHISTSYVFSGTAGRPYVEEDDPDPVTFYGDSKLLGENLVMASGCAYTIIRLPDIIPDMIDISKNFLFRKHGRSFSCIAGHTVSPVFESEAAAAIAAVCEKKLTGIYHFSPAASLTVKDLITGITSAALTDNDSMPGIFEVSAFDYETAAPRPAFNVLDNTKFVSHTGFVPAGFSESISAAAAVSADLIRASINSTE